MRFKKIKKTISFITLIAFLSTNILYAAPSSRSLFKNKKVDYKKLSTQSEQRLQKKKAIFRDGDDRTQQRRKQAKRVLQTHLKDLSQIHIPSEYGRVIEVYDASKDEGRTTDHEPRLIVHIQDLHTNPEAQLNEASILEILVKDYNLGLVCSEGAEGEVDTSSVSSFPDYEVREKTARLFIDSGELTAEEYLSITKYPDLPIWGIEDKDIYFKNILEFNKIIRFSPSSQVFISQAQKALDELKPRIYSKELLMLDQKETDYENESIETDEYLRYLTSYIQKFDIPTSKYKNIALLTEATEEEKRIDQAKIMQEYQNLLLNLQAAFSKKNFKSETNSLMVKARLFKDKKISPFSFYSYLRELALRHIPEDIAKYKNLNDFIDYLAKVNSLDSVKLFNEMEDLSYEIKLLLAKTNEQKDLAKSLRNIKFLEGFFNLKISNEELDYYLSNRSSHKVGFFKSFLDKALKQHHISNFIDYNPDLIDARLEEIEDFYKTVKKRDVAMVNNSISEIEKRDSKVTALISGGFHTKGITRMLRDRGYSYIVVSPYSSTEIDEENYHFLLSGKRRPLSELIDKLDDSLRLSLTFSSEGFRDFLMESLVEYREDFEVLGIDLEEPEERFERILIAAGIRRWRAMGKDTAYIMGRLVKWVPEDVDLKDIVRKDGTGSLHVDLDGDYVQVAKRGIRKFDDIKFSRGKGAILGALEAISEWAEAEGRDLMIDGMSEDEFHALRSGFGESVRRDELDQLEIMGVRREENRLMFHVQVTKDFLGALPDDVKDNLNLGKAAFDDLGVEEIDRMKGIINHHALQEPYKDIIRFSGPEDGKQIVAVEPAEKIDIKNKNNRELYFTTILEYINELTTKTGQSYRVIDEDNMAGLVAFMKGKPEGYEFVKGRNRREASFEQGSLSGIRKHYGYEGKSKGRIFHLDYGKGDDRSIVTFYTDMKGNEMLLANPKKTILAYGVGTIASQVLRGLLKSGIEVIACNRSFDPAKKAARLLGIDVVTTKDYVAQEGVRPEFENAEFVIGDVEELLRGELEGMKIDAIVEGVDGKLDTKDPEEVNETYGIKIPEGLEKFTKSLIVQKTLFERLAPEIPIIMQGGNDHRQADIVFESSTASALGIKDFGILFKDDGKPKDIYHTSCNTTTLAQIMSILSVIETYIAEIEVASVWINRRKGDRGQRKGLALEEQSADVGSHWPVELLPLLELQEGKRLYDKIKKDSKGNPGFVASAGMTQQTYFHVGRFNLRVRLIDGTYLTSEQLLRAALELKNRRIAIIQTDPKNPKAFDSLLPYGHFIWTQEITNPYISTISISDLGTDNVEIKFLTLQESNVIPSEIATFFGLLGLTRSVDLANELSNEILRVDAVVSNLEEVLPVTGLQDLGRQDLDRVMTSNRTDGERDENVSTAFTKPASITINLPERILGDNAERAGFKLTQVEGKHYALNHEGRDIAILRIDEENQIITASSLIEDDSDNYYTLILEYLHHYTMDTGKAIEFQDTDLYNLKAFIEGPKSAYLSEPGRNRSEADFEEGGMIGVRKKYGYKQQDTANRIFHLDYGKGENRTILTYRTEDRFLISPKKTVLAYGFGTIVFQVAKGLLKAGIEVIACNRSFGPAREAAEVYGLDVVTTKDYVAQKDVITEFEGADFVIGDVEELLRGELIGRKIDVILEGVDGKLAIKDVRALNEKYGIELPEGIKKFTNSLIVQYALFEKFAPQVPILLQGGNDHRQADLVFETSTWSAMGYNDFGALFNEDGTQRNIYHTSCNTTTLAQITSVLNLLKDDIEEVEISDAFINRSQANRAQAKALANQQITMDGDYHWNVELRLLLFDQIDPDLRVKFRIDAKGEPDLTATAATAGQTAYHFGMYELRVRLKDGSYLTPQRFNETLLKLKNRRLALIQTDPKVTKVDGLSVFSNLLWFQDINNPYISTAHVIPLQDSIGVVFQTFQESNVIPSEVATIYGLLGLTDSIDLANLRANGVLGVDNIVKRLEEDFPVKGLEYPEPERDIERVSLPDPKIIEMVKAGASKGAESPDTLASNENLLAEYLETAKRYLDGEIEIPTFGIDRMLRLTDLKSVPHIDLRTITGEKRTDLLKESIEYFKKLKERNGKIAVTVLAAGAASRMRKTEGLPTILKNAQKDDPDRFGSNGDRDLPIAKALLPAAKVGNRWLSFLDVHLVNVDRINNEFETLGLGRPFLVKILSNEEYQDSIVEEIERGRKDGIHNVNPKDVLFFYQRLGYRVAATEDDVNKHREDFADEEEYEEALRFSQENEGKVLTDLGGAQEGHGEYWHAHFETGKNQSLPLYLEQLDAGVEFDAFRNIDNMALLDEDWLIIFGNVLKNKLTVSMEVSRRPKGESGKGGGFVISDGRPAQIEDDVAQASMKKYSFDLDRDEGINNQGKDNPMPINNATGIIKFPDALNAAYDLPSVSTRNVQELFEIGQKGRAGFSMVPTFKIVKGTDGKSIGTILFETRAWDIWHGNESTFGLALVPSTVDVEENLLDDMSQVRFTPLKTKENYDEESLQHPRQAVSERAIIGELLSEDFRRLASNENLASLLQSAINGDKDAYQEIKRTPVNNLISEFENSLPTIVENLPESLFGFGFGYDIRGNAQKVEGGTVDMTPENLYLIGKLLGSQYADIGDNVLVTGDQRHHTPILRYAMALGYASVGVNVHFSEDELTSGAHNVYSAENPENYKHQVQISGSHGVPQKNGAKIKIDFGENLLEPLYAGKLANLYKRRNEFRRNVSAGNINEKTGIQDAVVDMYDETLPPFLKDEILVVDSRTGAAGPIVAKFFEKRGFELVDVDEVLGIKGRKQVDIGNLLQSPEERNKIIAKLNEVWGRGEHNIILMLNMHADPDMGRGIWDPSKPEALTVTIELIKTINTNLESDMPKAIGGVFDGDADRFTGILEDGFAVPSFEMTLPYYQRFLLDPQNRDAVIKMVEAGGDPLWLSLDVRSNNKLSGLIDNINSMFQQETGTEDLDFIQGYMINTGYPPQLDFIKWRIRLMDEFIENTPELSNDTGFMKNYDHLKRTYFTAEASGHNFFQIAPGNPYRPCDDGLAALSVLVNIRETISDIEAPLLGMAQKSEYELGELFATFPTAFSSGEVRIPISNDIKISTATKIGDWLKKRYGSELKPNRDKEPIKVGDLLLQPKDDGFIEVAGFKAQLKDGRSALVRWSNTEEQLTLIFEGYDWDSLINIIQEVTNRIRQEGVNVVDLDKEIGRLKEVRKNALQVDRMASNENVTRIVAKLDQEDMRGQMARLYGEPFERAVKLGASKMAEAGFETKKDGTKVNRMGWTLENLKWLLENPDKIDNVIKDAEHITRTYKYVIFSGMGGSGLSVQTVKDTFGESGTKIYSLRTTDPAVIKDILDEIAEDTGSLEEALRQTLVIAISKSGNTKETVSHKAYFEKLFSSFYSPETSTELIDKVFETTFNKEAKKDLLPDGTPLSNYEIEVKKELIAKFKKHIWVITDKGSPMDTGDYTQREIQLNGKEDIGGRFTSPTTHVFLLPLAIVAPEKLRAVLDNARVMNEIEDIDKDTFINLGAYLYNMAAESGKDKLTFIVPDELQDLPMWSEQLFEESLGKDGKGITVFYGEDIKQTSLKEVKDNDRVFLRINIGGKKTNGVLWKHLKKNGYPVFEINIEDTSSIGGIMLGLQRTVATIGYLWDICFVDQPAVEGYKNATRDVMAGLKPGEKVEVPADWKSVSFGKLNLYYDRLIKVGAISQGELETEVQALDSTMDDAAAVYAAIVRILDRKTGFEAKELTSYGRMTNKMRTTLRDARTDIFTDALKMPSKLGEGPDKNHSYQQNIEGGKDMWFSTYFMPLVVEQPEALEYDDNLIKAQTIGTVNSIVKRGRKVALITFDSTIQEAEKDLDDFFNMVKSYIVPGFANRRGVEIDPATRLASTSNANLSRIPLKRKVGSMNQILVVSAEKVIADKVRFEKWIVDIRKQRKNIDFAVVILAMDKKEYEGVKEYQEIAFIKLSKKDISEDDAINVNALLMVSIDTEERYFNGFNVGILFSDPTLPQYQASLRAIAEGV